MHVNDLLKIAVEHGASDLHLKVGSYPMMRVRGDLVPAAADRRLDHADTVAIAAAVMSTGQRQKFTETQDIDLAYSVPGLGRFRCNVFQQRGTIGMVLRVIPIAVKTLDELGLPSVLKAIAEEERGLGTRNRPDGERQEHDAGRARGTRERHPLGPRHDHRGPDRVPPP